MFIIPFDRRLDWRRPPKVTLALVLVNVLVFFLLQGDEDRRLDEAVDYYFQSGLHALELPRYRDYRLAQGAAEPDAGAEEEDGEGPTTAEMLELFALLADADFMQRLRAGQIIQPAAADYEQWRLLRAEFERRLGQVASFGWGFTPAQPHWYTALTHMFLHGDSSHLFGNMFFLFAVGFLVEGALGSAAYLLAYLLTGLGALGLFALSAFGSTLPLVGASGAISGLMGMYAVLFGRRHIAFFYFVLVYFDYVRAPAIWLLAAWLGFELVQYLWLSPDSNVAYMAHIGGLLSGAAAGLLLQRLPGGVNQDYLAEGERDVRRERLYGQVLTYMERLDFAKATPLLEQLLQQTPEDPELLGRLLTCTRPWPASEAYHRAAQRVFALPAGEAAHDVMVLAAYRDYLKQAKPGPRLSAAGVRALLPRLLRLGEIGEAERLLALMLKHEQAFPDAAPALASLARALQSRQQAQRARGCLQLLAERFPNTPEAAWARRMLGQ